MSDRIGTGSGTSLESRRTIGAKSHTMDSTTGAKERLKEDREAEWTTQRRYVSGLIEGSWFSISLACIIMFHMCLVVMETDLRASDEPVQFWAKVLSAIFLLCYACESLCRIYVDQWDFIQSRWNMFDLLLVSSDIIGTGLEAVVGNVPSVAIFRLFRVVRVIRVFRSLTGFRELFMMLHGLAAAMKAILWATVMIMVALLFWSLMGVELIQPLVTELAEAGKLDKNCVRCPYAFRSVWAGLLTLLQIVLAGDSWGAVAVPLGEEYPVTLLFSLGSFVSVNLGIMNLIVAVIVDRAHQAREEDELLRLVEKESNFAHAKKKMGDMFKKMDQDRSGTITCDELVDGIDNEPEFANVLRLMDISSDDLQLVFKVLDKDGSGALDYNEFCEQLWKMKTHDAHTLLIFVRHLVANINATVGDIFDIVSQSDERLEHAALMVDGGRRISATSSPDMGGARKSIISCRANFQKLQEVVDASRSGRASDKTVALDASPPGDNGSDGNAVFCSNAEDMCSDAKDVEVKSPGATSPGSELAWKMPPILSPDADMAWKRCRGCLESLCQALDALQPRTAPLLDLPSLQTGVMPRSDTGSWATDQDNDVNCGFALEATLPITADSLQLQDAMTLVIGFLQTRHAEFLKGLGAELIRCPSRGDRLRTPGNFPPQPSSHSG